MADYETLTYEVRQGLARITLARPDKRNAMNRQMFVDLAEAVERAADLDVRGVLLSAQGPVFCAGIDLTVLAEFPGTAADTFRTFVRIAQRPYQALARLEKPTLAAVQGHAVGAGFQLALACDLRIATPDARFGMLEARYGLIPDLGGMYHLVRLVGPARAKELVWSARQAEVEEAERIGLVNRVAPAEALAEQAEAFLGEVTAHSPVTTALSKRLMDQTLRSTLDEEFEHEAAAQATSIASNDHNEAVAAFLENRPPRFSGR